MKTERNLQIIEFRKEGLSLEEIGKKTGLTRQRVQQIEELLGLGPRRVKGEFKRYRIECAACGKEVFSLYPERRYCCRKCFLDSKKVLRTKEEKELFLKEKREKNRIRAKEYYYNVLKKKKNWREIVSKRNQKYLSGF